jgi:hypothetical protein
MWRFGSMRTPGVGFLAESVGFPGGIRHGFRKQNQSLRSKMSGMSVCCGRGVLGILSTFLAVIQAAAAGVHIWTPIGRQTGGPGRARACKSLRNLVGPPRFELGTSCTPSKRLTRPMNNRCRGNLHRFGTAPPTRHYDYLGAAGEPVADAPIRRRWCISTLTGYNTGGMVC